MSTSMIVLLTIVGYFILLLLISWAASRGSDSKTALTGGKNASGILAAIALVGAPISGVTFVSVPGMVITKNFSYMQMVLGFVAGYFVVAYLLVPLFYRFHLVSIYGYLHDRFGRNTHRSGAWFFFISKMLGAAVRFFVVCVTLQALVFEPLGIPFMINVTVTIALIFLYTLQGGVKTVLWTDALKSFCLIFSVVLCILFIANGLGLGLGELWQTVVQDPHSKVFHLDDVRDGQYFWKQFIAGLFLVVAMTGLDQDMMQRTLATPNPREARKSLIIAGITQVFVVGFFLILGCLLYVYTESKHIPRPEHSDNLFGLVAFSQGIPLIVGVLFILGLVSAAYSAAGSALTSLTTSFLVDILGADKTNDESRLVRVRKITHVAMAVIMGLVIVVFNAINNTDAVSAVYTLASYTYGPILGLFAFGMITKAQVRDGGVPIVCIAAPTISFGLQYWLKEQFDFTMSFELLLVNALLTMLGLAMLIKRNYTY